MEGGREKEGVEEKAKGERRDGREGMGERGMVGGMKGAREGGKEGQKGGREGGTRRGRHRERDGGR